jgi:threonine dehydrogenase-like Zn-dependent dehydrogenase
VARLSFASFSPEDKPMKAVAVFPSRRELALLDRPTPRLASPHDVVLKIRDVGVCGTDKEICRFDYGTPPRGDEFLVLGHEAVAEVVEVGASVRAVKTGDLVVPTVRRPCVHETCVPCRADAQDFCTTGEFVERGITGAHGFMTEFVTEHAMNLRPIARELADVAVLVEPLTIAEKALLQLHHLQQRLPWTCSIDSNAKERWCHTVLVLGAGPVGLLGAMAFRAAGYRAFVYSREGQDSDKASIVRAIGAEYVPADDVPVERLRQTLGAIDVVYEAVGASSLAFQAIHQLGQNGVFVFTGVPGRKAPIAVDTDRLMRDLVLKNQVMLGTVNAGKEAFDAAIRDLGQFMIRWPAAVRALITRHPVSKFKELLEHGGDGIKNVLTFGES